MTMTGIDISGDQPVNVPGPWEFIVTKSTEGNNVVNPIVGPQWAAAARTRRGLYHYARPHISSGPVQAMVFIADALARGFRPGVDMWQLDAENGENAGVSAQEWATFIDSFMLLCLAHLGPRGFLYLGWPSVVAFGLQAQIQRYNWWLPDYGNNNGNVNPLAPGTPWTLVVIHQYTSIGGLDRNVITNYTKYNAAASPAPAPKPEVAPMHNPPLSATWVADMDCPTGGGWLLLTDGGVFTVGSAPYHGSPTGSKVVLPAGVTWATIRAPQDVGKPGGDYAVGGGNHYTCLASNGARYCF